MENLLQDAGLKKTPEGLITWMQRLEDSVEHLTKIVEMQLDTHGKSNDEDFERVWAKIKEHDASCTELSLTLTAVHTRIDALDNKTGQILTKYLDRIVTLFIGAGVTALVAYILRIL